MSAVGADRIGRELSAPLHSGGELRLQCLFRGATAPTSLRYPVIHFSSVIFETAAASDFPSFSSIRARPARDGRMIFENGERHRSVGPASVNRRFAFPFHGPSTSTLSSPGVHRSSPCPHGPMHSHALVRLRPHLFQRFPIPRWPVESRPTVQGFRGTNRSTVTRHRKYTVGTRG